MGLAAYNRMRELEAKRKAEELAKKQTVEVKREEVVAEKTVEKKKSSVAEKTTARNTKR